MQDAEHDDNIDLDGVISQDDENVLLFWFVRIQIDLKPNGYEQWPNKPTTIDLLESEFN